MSLRNLVASKIRPRTRGQLIDLEVGLRQSFIISKVAKYLQGYLIKPYLARPQEIDIEVTSSCDADCIMCPRKAMRRRVGPMDLGLFKKIVDEAVALDVPELHLNGYGEISVLRNYREYLSYIRKQSRKIKININTNGMRMSEEMCRAYVEFRVDVVNITIDGATAATYESIRQQLKLDVVESNVKRLIQIRDELGKKYPLVTVHMIAMPQNQHEAELFLDKWKGVADRVGISGLVSRVGSVPFVQIDNRKWEQTPCFLLWNQMPILNDGTVALCCDDWDGRAAQGNLNNKTIREIWTSKRRTSLRSLHLSREGGKIPVCEGCKQPRQGPFWFKQNGNHV